MNKQSLLQIGPFILAAIVVGVLSSFCDGFFSSCGVILGGGLAIAIVITVVLARIQVMGAAVDAAAAGVIAILIAVIVRVFMLVI